MSFIPVAMFGEYIEYATRDCATTLYYWGLPVQTVQSAGGKTRCSACPVTRKNVIELLSAAPEDVGEPYYEPGIE